MIRKKLDAGFMLSFAAVAALACLLPACRGDKVEDKAGLLADKLGRQEAKYMERRTEGDRRESVLSFDAAAVPRPAGMSDFTRLEHLPPVEQGDTGTCWAHAAISLLESEAKRQGRESVKLSEMYIVYWEYVEKARRFIRMKGDSHLGQGSEPGLAMERAAQHGLVRESDYTGLPAGGTVHRHDHTVLFDEFRSFLKDAKTRGEWDEACALTGVRAILDRHLGKPPERIKVDGSEITPVDYLRKVLRLEPADYVCFTSFMYAPFFTKTEFRVPDNWNHGAYYHNLPLQEFQSAFLRALRKGYTAAMAVDMSEPGYLGEENIAIVPSFDIPRNFIDQSSREFRFVNRTSTDDHSVHCVGYTDNAGENWFLIKDSWESAWFGKHKGYFFHRSDYFRLKCLMFMVHKDAARDILGRFETGK